MLILCGHILERISSVSRMFEGNYKAKRFIFVITNFNKMFSRFGDKWVYPLTHNFPNWPDTFQKPCRIFCMIFKVCLTILGHYALKGQIS